MKVLLAAMQWDYGFPERGLSFEYVNLFDAMRRMEGLDVRFYDFMADYKVGGHARVRQQLVEAVTEFDPDLLFTILFEGEVPEDVLIEMRDRRRPITFNWFCDDHWRFESFTRRMAPLFNACSTTAMTAVPKYDRIGYANVIKTQWAGNPHLYRPTGRPLVHDITFVGQPHGTRRQVISGLRERGLPVRTWGTGWEQARLSQDEMVSVFAESRVNLNLSNSSGSAGWKRLYKRQRADQIKGRNFEIPSCGGFQLSGWADNIEDYFIPDQEIVLFGSEEELADAIERYLADEVSRRAIAEAGYRRVLNEHTYAHRFNAIFKFLGLR